MRPSHILLVDDDPFILTGIGKNLETEGYNVTTADSGEKAYRLLEESNFDLVITDLVMEKVDGIQVLQKAKQLYSDIMVIILTGYGDMSSAIDALRLKADDYILKPCEPEEIKFRVAKCLEHLELSRKLKIYEDILPICCVCKKVRDDEGTTPGDGEWMSIEKYMWEKAKVAPTSTYCPECAQKAKDELDLL